MCETKTRTCCSLSCSGKRAKILGTHNSGFKKGKSPWNKGLSNPNGAINGKKSAAKLSATVKGRKRFYRPDGSWTWSYPNKLLPN